MSLLHSTSVYLLAFILFILLLLSYFAGITLHKRLYAKKTDRPEGTTIGSSLLGLLALLLAFSFGMSNGRYDTRRVMVVDEANAITTAILRSDVYPDSIRQLLRTEFRMYIEARILFYQQGVDGENIHEHYKQSRKVSKRIWRLATAYARQSTEIEEAAQLLPALNTMIDIASSRLSWNLAKVPDSIVYFLFILSLCSSFLMGYERKDSADWISITGFSFMLSLTTLIILDMDRPRSGLIDLDEPNKRMTELLEEF